MGPIERFFVGLVAAVTAAIAPADGEPEPAEPIPAVIPAENPPLPRPRPINEAPPGDGNAAVMMWAEERVPADDLLNRLAAVAGAETELPAPVTEEAPEIVPLPRPNPLTTEAELAALPAGDFTPRPPLRHDDACLANLAALPINAAILAPVIGENACGIATPLMIDEIGADEFAVALAPTALVDCSVAGAFTHWLEEDVQPAARSILGQWVVGVRVASSYACRGRNNDPGEPLSEHAFGRAIDISAFQLADGTWVNVRPFAGDAPPPEAEFLAAIRAGACGPFTTVLGPGVDLHDDHLHLDLATHGANGGLYCP